MSDKHRKPVLPNVVLAVVIVVMLVVGYVGPIVLLIETVWLPDDDRTAPVLHVMEQTTPSQDDPLRMWPPLPMHHPAKAEIDTILDNLSVQSEEDYRQLSQRHRFVWDVWSMDTAMMSGGSDHWFRVMGHHATETLEALQAIGAKQAYRTIKRVCELFPDLGTGEESVETQYFGFFQRHGKIDDYLLAQDEMPGNFAEDVELDLYQRLLDYWQRADPMAR